MLNTTGKTASTFMAATLCAVSLGAALTSPAAQAQAQEGRSPQERREPGQGPGRQLSPGPQSGPGSHPDGNFNRRESPTNRPDAHPEQRAPLGPDRWWDNAHGHARDYPNPGLRVRSLPPRSHVVIWGGVNYAFREGVWYAPQQGTWVVVHPPIGIMVSDLPDFCTVVLIAGLSYHYANGVYYRERMEGGYEVVQPPIAGTTLSTGGEQLYIYPRQGQSAQQQADDEYACHRWAVSQSHFDPTGATVKGADGATTLRTGTRSDYVRAQTACLEGRGYTVK